MSHIDFFIRDSIKASSFKYKEVESRPVTKNRFTTLAQMYDEAVNELDPSVNLMKMPSLCFVQSLMRNAIHQSRSFQKSFSIVFEPSSSRRLYVARQEHERTSAS